MLDQRRGTCQLGTGTVTFLKKGGEEEEESLLETLMNERDCSAVRRQKSDAIHTALCKKFPTKFRELGSPLADWL